MEQFVRAGLTLSYSITGKGPWLVLCHALATHRELWRHQIEILSATHSVLAYDLRGHGRSSLPTTGDYTFSTQADDVLALMDHLKITTATLIGISVGGEIAQVAAYKYPTRCSRLVLVSTAYYTDSRRASVWEQRMSDATRQGMHGIAAGTATRWTGDDFAATQPELFEWCRQTVADTPLAAYLGNAAVIRNMDLSGSSSRIACPTLVICGDRDENTGPAVAECLSQLIPGARLHIIRDAGHFPNLERSSQFNNVLQEFLRG